MTQPPGIAWRHRLPRIRDRFSLREGNDRHRA